MFVLDLSGKSFLLCLFYNVEHIEVIDVCKTYIVVIAAGCQFINDDNNSIY